MSAPWQATTTAFSRKVQVMATFTGTAGNDTANATAGTLTGFTGGTVAQLQDGSGDIFNAGAGNDTVTAGAGDDSFRGMAGNDTFNGGAGFDEIRYDTELANGGTTGVTVNLITGLATDAFGTTDTFTSVESIRGTNLADTLTGGNAANGTGTGVAEYDGFEGYRGLGGNDIINGGAGYDEVRYDADASSGGIAGQGVIVDLGAGTATDGFGNHDTLIGIEGVRGTMFADNLTGSAVDNTFVGLGGNDVIIGGDGFDSVNYSIDAANGGAAGVNVNLATGVAIDGFGNTDTLSGIQSVRGTNQIDTLTGSGYVGFNQESFAGLGGADIITGGLGYDEVRYDLDASNGGAGAVNVNLNNGTATDGFGAIDTLSGIENVRGTLLADVITGDAFNNVFRGLAGADIMDGGAGSDTVAYDQDFNVGGNFGVTVNLANNSATDGFGNSDTIVNFENVRGTKFVDTLTGDANDNDFTGLAGNDVFFGGAGSDEVRYDQDEYRGGTFGGVTVNFATNTATDGFGNTDSLNSIEEVRGSKFGDTFTGSGADEVFRGLAGNDIIDGGAGSDWVSYSSDIFARQESQTLQAVVVNLANGTATDSFGGTDTLTNIENVAGAALGDTLTGDANDNIFRGYSGGDIITGGLGSDTVDYSRDADFAANHFMTGGTLGVEVNLAAGFARDGFGTTDTLSGIENAIGTANADIFIGDGNANSFLGGDNFDNIYGGAGDDILSGEAGNDVIAGDAGNDQLYGGDGGDVISELAAGALSGNDIIDGGNGADIIYAAGGDDTVFGGIADAANNYVSLGDGTDTYQGSMGTDIVLGGNGDDTITGNSGDDVMYGEVGNDTIYGGAGVDILSGDVGNDNLYGGDDNDLIVADDGDDVLDGGAGGDTMLGLEGADTLYGGVGNDYVDGGNGIDLMYGGDGNDTMVGDFGTLTGGADTMFGDAGDDIMLGYTGNDIIDGGDGNDRLYGFQDNDTINGGAGSDDVYGGVGDDILTGGAGLDQLYGGSGNDDFRYASQGFNQEFIWDFTGGAGASDRLSFSTSVFANEAAVRAAAIFSSGNTYITTVDGSQIVLVSVNIANMNSDDFAFF
jgi:Ca2+-binding RTX toxin-like protein